MNSKIKKIVGTGVSAVALSVGMFAITAAPSEAAGSSVGTASVSMGRKVVRSADNQKCLALTEVRKIVHGKGHVAEGGRYWNGRGKAEFLYVEFNGSKCSQGAFLYYDNGDALAWIDGRVLWA